jgi:translation initiation factor 1 (eIF-1/SUI1)
VFFRKGEMTKVQVLVEPRQGRKWMTRILGLQAYGVDVKDVARRCQKKFASSATVVKAPGQKGKIEVFEVNVQGSWEEQTVAMLTTELNIPSKYIESSTKDTKKGGPKR